MTKVIKFTGTSEAVLSNIADAITSQRAEGFTLASHSLAYYKRENGENVGVSILIFVK